ncbi:hypothetical protein AAMO2058_001755100 [Amorphochlora amoebiformis]
MIGSILGYEVGTNLDQDRKIISNLLFAGFGYLTTSGGKVIPTLNSTRAVLLLPGATETKAQGGAAGKEKKRGRSPASPAMRGSGKRRGKKEGMWDPGHRKLKKRAKDVARVVRNLDRPEGKLSLRVNTDFKQTMVLLKNHHKDSWAGEKLQKVWEAMWKAKDMIVFELWYGEQLIAADIAHIVGRSFYVATRFFNKKYRKFQPGFLLALAEGRVLAKAGFVLWDLGGTDSSPNMAYKSEVTFEMSRPEFLSRFLPVRVGRTDIPTGVLVEDIQPDDLLL